MNKNRLLDIFNNIKPEDRQIRYHQNSRVLIVDGLNTFLRSFSAINKSNVSGHHIGGLTGFLRSIGYLVKLHSPTRVIIVFDGEDGSTSRKFIFPEYKGKRDKKRTVNFKSFNNVDEEQEAKYNEMVRLMDYLNFLPVTCMCIDKLEADDIIGYLANKIYKDYEDSQTIIVSTDTDFLQLVNDRVKVFSPKKKRMYNEEAVIQDYNVHPSNFLLYKTLIGDDSDNIPGVEGIGEKNVTVLFEILKENSEKKLQDLYDICENPPKKSVLYERILNSSNRVEIFYKIMNLKEPTICDSDIDDIRRQFFRPTGSLRKLDFIKMYHKDKLDGSMQNIETWLDIFSTLNSYK